MVNGFFCMVVLHLYLIFVAGRIAILVNWIHLPCFHHYHFRLVEVCRLGIPFKFVRRVFNLHSIGHGPYFQFYLTNAYIHTHEAITTHFIVLEKYPTAKERNRNGLQHENPSGDYVIYHSATFGQRRSRYRLIELPLLNSLKVSTVTLLSWFS